MIDCHIHTKYSDGLSDVEEIIRQNQNLNMECFSITDHDTIYELKKYCGISQNLIFGTEITAVYCYKEIHILAYFPKFPPDEFESFLKSNRIRSAILIRRKKSNKASYVNTVTEITKVVKEYGGISILAHPFKYWDVVDDIIDNCDGIELVYPSHEAKDIERIIEMYRERCRFFTAGSDFHGERYTGNNYISQYCELYKEYLQPFIKCIRKDNLEVIG